MKKKRGKLADFLLAAPILFILELTRILPRSLGCRFWDAISMLGYYLVAGRRRIMRKNMEMAFPAKKAKELDELGRKAYISIGRTYAEFCKTGSLNDKNVDEFATFEGMENLKRALEKGKGVIVPTMHYYNVELIPAALAARGFPAHWVMREVDNFFIDRKMDEVRTGSGLKTIKKEGAYREMIRTVRKGEILFITTDQKAGFNEVWVKFLGLWSATVRSPAVLSLRTGAAIVPMFSTPQPDQTHHAYFLPAIKYDSTGDMKKDVFAITQIIADLQTEFIGKHPELWLWLHRKWSMSLSQAEEKEAEAMLQSAVKNGLKADCSVIK
ncbi:MAG: lysophospholipid acyltransferase family protein [Nitrospinota bacterium]